MVLGNTPRRETNFYVEANKSYSFGMYFKTPDGEPVDLTDCVLRLVAAETQQVGGSEVISKIATSADPRTGFVNFNLQAEELALDPSSYPYDVTIIPESGYSTPIIKGYIEVGANTDTDVSNVYQDFNATSDVTATLEPFDVVEVTIERVDGLYLIVSNLMEDFAEQMEAEVSKAADSATDSSNSASLSASYAEEMRVWLDNAGYPFWKGTQAEYDALTPKREVLYLITDEVNPSGRS